jgi:hypothetical protein
VSRPLPHICSTCLQQAHAVNFTRKVDGCACFCHEYEKQLKAAKDSMEKNKEALEELA